VTAGLDTGDIFFLDGLANKLIHPSLVGQKKLVDKHFCHFGSPSHLHVIASRRRLRTPRSGSPERKQSSFDRSSFCGDQIAMSLTAQRFAHRNDIEERYNKIWTLRDFTEIMSRITVVGVSQF
jgi:hypothetical protein